MAKKSLTIITVNYNAGEVLLEELDSIREVKDEASLTVWVVDNASSDDSLTLAKRKYPEVNFIENRENIGFGRANNQAIERVKSEYVLFLNPDARLEKGVLSSMLDYMESDLSVGAATCEIVFENRKVDLTAHRGFPTPWASLLYMLGNDSLYHLSGRVMDEPHEVDAISGAFFLTRKSVLEDVGMFDEDYFMYAEDIDLCYRIKQSGKKIMYLPKIKIIHKKGVSSGIKKHSSDLTQATIESKTRAFNAFYETMKIFYKKHYAQKYPFFINWLVYLGINLRWWLAKRKMTV